MFADPFACIESPTQSLRPRNAAGSNQPAPDIGHRLRTRIVDPFLLRLALALTPVQLCLTVIHHTRCVTSADGTVT